mgnify:CR=1 FL=1
MTGTETVKENSFQIVELCTYKSVEMFTYGSLPSPPLPSHSFYTLLSLPAPARWHQQILLLSLGMWYSYLKFEINNILNIWAILNLIDLIAFEFRDT